MRKIFLALSVAMTGWLQAKSFTQEKFIFQKAPFASCHASTLTATKSGKILCAWFAGSSEGAKDVGIWASQFDGEQWSVPQKIVLSNGMACWNPVLMTTKSNEILLFYKQGPSPQQWSGFLSRSLDGGLTWLKAEPLPAGVIGPAKNRPLQLEDGTLLCGSSTESWQRWGCWIDITEDEGRSWQKSSPINLADDFFGIIQPALFFTGKGQEIRLLARSLYTGAICTAVSTDLGRSWSVAKPTMLPNPNSAIDAIRLQDGRILLVYNHSKEERYPLNVAISEDGGNEWQELLVLENEPGEYSYPCVIQTADGLVHISYTWNRKKIKYLTLNLADFAKDETDEELVEAASHTHK